MRRFIALADVVSVTAAAGLGGLLLVRIALSVAELNLLLFAVGAVLGYLAADVASGVIHWLCDTYSNPRAPLIGPMIIAPFREHHADPMALVRHGLFERNGNNCLAAVPLLIVALRSLPPDAAAHGWHDLQSGFSSALALTLCLTNQIHAWAHSASAPRLVRALQRAGVLLAPQHHGAHHRGARAYAVVSGWSNAWLDRAVTRAEALLAAFGLRPSYQSAPRRDRRQP